MKKLWLLFFALSFANWLLAQETPQSKLKTYSEKYYVEKVYTDEFYPYIQKNTKIRIVH